MTARKPYQGTFRKLVIAFDVGTTYSGISFAVLDPGIPPVIQGVTKFPAQQKIGGDSKIPSVLWYNERGQVQAVGAEAFDEAFLEKADDEGYIKVEWWKLHMRPKALGASHITDDDIPPLPRNKTALSVFADFLCYLFKAAKTYIIETTPSGASFWASVEHHIDFVLTHPNGWEGRQQGLMRQAAVQAGLISDGIGQERLQFVSEGEASLHFCINKNVLGKKQLEGKGVIIVDAGGGTVDLSAYGAVAKSANAFEEIAPTECRLQGSVFVGRRARAHVQNKLKNTRWGATEDVNHIADVFDKTTKLSFRNSSEPAYIRFGNPRDKDASVDIRNGQLKLLGECVAEFFEPSVRAIIEAVQAQRDASTLQISNVLLVGGFAAKTCRPDGHVNKAVADGAISFYLDHFVSTRVAGLTYGIQVYNDFDVTDQDHILRDHMTFYNVSGTKCVNGIFSNILDKGIRVNEEKEFRCHYEQTSAQAQALNSISVDILCYRGASPAPKWLDLAPVYFTPLCTVTADTSGVYKPRNAPLSSRGSYYYKLQFEVVLLFGLTELKAQIAWKENGIEKRCPASVVYDSVVKCV